jgi:PEP-CTERM motif
MKIKGFAAICVLALAAPAMAATCTSTSAWGDMGPPAAQLFGNSFGSAGAFSDCYTFTLDDAAVGFGGTIETDAAWNKLDIDISSVSLFSGSNLIASDSTPGVFEGGFTFGGLNAGSYTLAVNGLVSRDFGFTSKGVSYQGGIVTLAAPVPEPEAYAMMLAGFFGVGFGVLRRKKQA